MSTFL